MGLLQLFSKKSSKKDNVEEKKEEPQSIPSPYKIRSVDEELSSFKEQLLSGTFTIKSPNTIRREMETIDKLKAEQLQREEIREYNAKYFPNM